MTHSQFDSVKIMGHLGTLNWFRRTPQVWELLEAKIAAVSSIHYVNFLTFSMSDLFAKECESLCAQVTQFKRFCFEKA